MCCFATRVFLLISATVLSFVLHGFFPQIPVVAFYFLLANLISLMIFSLFFAGKLPSFVKPAAVHYFSFIGGFAAGLAVALFKREQAGANFVKIELFIFAFWLVLACFLALNFSWVSANLAQVFSA